MYRNSQCQWADSKVSVVHFIFFEQEVLKSKRTRYRMVTVCIGYADNGNAFNYNSPYLIRIRGLPWSTTKRDILDFFAGVHILNGEDGIHLITLALTPNRPLGEAYIQLATERDLERAHSFDRKNLGSRYIEGRLLLQLLLGSRINLRSPLQYLTPTSMTSKTY